MQWPLWMSTQWLSLCFSDLSVFGHGYSASARGRPLLSCVLWHFRRTCGPDVQPQLLRGMSEEVLGRQQTQAVPCVQERVHDRQSPCQPGPAEPLRGLQGGQGEEDLRAVKHMWSSRRPAQALLSGGQVSGVRWLPDGGSQESQVLLHTGGCWDVQGKPYLYVMFDMLVNTCGSHLKHKKYIIRYVQHSSYRGLTDMTNIPVYNCWTTAVQKCPKMFIVTIQVIYYKIINYACDVSYVHHTKWQKIFDWPLFQNFLFLWNIIWFWVSLVGVT